MTDRLDLRRRLHDMAFRQAGYFGAAQARAVGYSYQAQKYHADRGNWVRVDRGMFRLADWPTDANDGYARWTAWSGGAGVVSHASAADVHDLGDLDPGTVHLTTSAVPTGRPGVTLHRAALDAADVQGRPTYRVTTPTRTLLDLAASTDSITQEQFDTVVDDALRLGVVEIRELRRRMDGFGPAAALRLERALAAVGAARA